ncbi:MAG: hypothetical protein LBL46_04760 [Rickettsiales bacterium]|jgi:hypothetical protein|nr:hypothetical protein [Rickettsiales bacterium]
MKKLFLILLLAGCGGAATKNRPAWIDAPAGACSETEFCAVGAGSTAAGAKADARAEIMRFFRSSIDSSARFVETESSSSASLDTQLSANGILEGVEIILNYNDGADFYSLAKLDKVVAAEQLRTKIDQADAEIKRHLGANTKRGARDAMRVEALRKELDNQYLILTGDNIPEPTDYQAAFARIRNQPGKIYSIAVTGDGSDEIETAVAAALSDNGNKIASANVERRVAGKITSASQFINVEGFVKYKYVLRLDAAEGGKKIGVLETTITEAGRDKSQTDSEAVQKLKAYIAENIFDLM